MFKVGNTYIYGGSTGAFPHFTIEGSTESEYLKEPCTLKCTNGEVPFIRGIWEPMVHAMCKCLEVDPLILECDYKCSLLEDDNRVAIMKETLEAIGHATVSDADAGLVCEIFDWNINNMDGNLTALDFSEMIITEMNEIWLRQYEGSCNGATAFEKNRRMILSMLFGRGTSKAICVIIESGVKLGTTLDKSGKLKIVVNGSVDLYNYLYNVLMLPADKFPRPSTESVRSILKAAEGS